MTTNYVAHPGTNEVTCSKFASTNRFTALIKNCTSDDVPKNSHNTPSALPIPITTNCDPSQRTKVNNKSLTTQTSKPSVTTNTTTTTIKPTATASTNNPLDLWHKRLCHLSLRITKTILTKYNILFSHTTSTLAFCKPCTINKIHQLPFLQSQTQYTIPLELVFSDL
ncbi:hypothetical protein AHAS_Ahas15G0225300 [Arachis hypogaea]